MRTIEQAIDITAPVSRVWVILTTPRLIRRWAKAFLPGICAESDWQEGSTLIWRKKDGNPAQRGVIRAIEQDYLLRVAFPPELNQVVAEPTEEFVETYCLTPIETGARLSIICGPLHLIDVDTLEPKWEEALANIKTLAENGDPHPARAKRPPIVEAIVGVS